MSDIESGVAFVDMRSTDADARVEEAPSPLTKNPVLETVSNIGLIATGVLVGEPEPFSG